VPNAESFPPEVQQELKTYVYRLIDPRNGETFYIGKGQRNRVFAHIREELSFEGEELDPKLERIRKIHADGFQVDHVIHRHGMDDETAMQVEAAVMDAYPGLSNLAGGAGTGDYGAMHAKQIIERYSAEPAVFRHKAVLINVSRGATEHPLYEATRRAWRMDRRKAEEAEVILANRQGLIVEAFVPKRWLDATTENFQGLEKDQPGRIGFEGEVAPEEIRELYVRKRVPDEYRPRGAANPIRYTWTD
jgi:hypothetical protein